MITACYTKHSLQTVSTLRPVVIALLHYGVESDMLDNMSLCT